GGRVADGGADRVAEVGRQPAVLDLQHLVPATCLVETERGAVLELRERVLELVAVVEDVAGREDRLQRRIRDAADAAERVRDLARLRLDLRLVREILEAAAAPRPIVRAPGLPPERARRQDLPGA